MIEVGQKVEIGQIVETDSQDHPTEINLNMDKISKEETLGEENL